MPSVPFPTAIPYEIWIKSVSVTNPSPVPSDNYQEGWHAAARQLQAMYAVNSPLSSCPPQETWISSLSANNPSFDPLLQFQEGWHACVKHLQDMFPDIVMRQDPFTGFVDVKSSHVEVLEELSSPRMIMLDDSMLSRGAVQTGGKRERLFIRNDSEDDGNSDSWTGIRIIAPTKRRMQEDPGQEGQSFLLQFCMRSPTTQDVRRSPADCRVNHVFACPLEKTVISGSMLTFFSMQNTESQTPPTSSLRNTHNQSGYTNDRGPGSVHRSSAMTQTQT